MAKEIERKFLIDTEKWGWKGTPVTMIQAYLAVLPDKVVRVRIAGDYAFLTIKGNRHGISRDEFEYSIPLNDALELLKICEYNPVEKTRYTFDFAGKKWEIDVFHGKNSGLIVAEVELQSASEEIILPGWIMKEVSDEEKYYNFNLAMHPFSEWQ